MRSTRPHWPPAPRTTARPASARTITRTITRPSSWILMATTSKLSVTSQSNGCSARPRRARKQGIYDRLPNGPVQLLLDPVVGLTQTRGGRGELRASVCVVRRVDRGAVVHGLRADQQA